MNSNNETCRCARFGRFGPSARRGRGLERHRPAARSLEFAAIGDQQYGPVGEEKWPALQASINRSNVEFTGRLRAFNSFEMPMIYAPGDNERTDCHRENNGGYDPLERLRAQLGTGYRDLFSVIEDHVITFERPALVVMGDSHIFRIDKRP